MFCRAKWRRGGLRISLSERPHACNARRTREKDKTKKKINIYINCARGSFGKFYSRSVQILLRKYFCIQSSFVGRLYIYCSLRVHYFFIQKVSYCIKLKIGQVKRVFRRKRHRIFLQINFHRSGFFPFRGGEKQKARAARKPPRKNYGKNKFINGKNFPTRGTIEVKR